MSPVAAPRIVPRLLLTVALLLGLPPAFAPAQGTAPAATSAAPGTISTAEIQSLIDTLENEADRNAFVANLKALVATGEVERKDVTDDLVARISERLSRVDEQVGALAAQLDDGSEMAAWVASQFTDARQRDLWLHTALQLVLVIAVAFLGWFLVSAGIRAQIRRYDRLHHGGWAARILLAFRRALLLLVPVASFAELAYLMMTLGDTDSATRAIAVAFVNAFVAVRTVLAVSQAFLLPLSARARPLPISDEQAAYLFVWTGRFAAVAAYGFFLLDLLGSLGLPDSSVALLFRLVGLALTAMVLIVILQSREPVARWIQTHPESGGGQLVRHRLADIWHVLTTIAVLVVFAVWAVDLEGGFLYLARGFAVTAAAVFGALLASTVLRRLLHRAFRLSDELHRVFRTSTGG